MSESDLSEKYNIYNLNFDGNSFDELHNLYADIFFPSVPTCDVVTALTKYVTEVIEPVGWTAVWKIPRKKSKQQITGYPYDCEILVEVHDVSMKQLQAAVEVLEVLSQRDSPDGTLNCHWLQGQTEVDVPLVQLYPLRDKNGMFLRTAQAIHTVRFFYDNLWRPWDEEDDEGSFVEKHLSSRLEFYFERVSGCLPEAVEHHCQELLSEAADIYCHLEKLQLQMTLSDSESELEEEDVRTCMQLRIRMDALQKEMEILENPLLRNLMSKKVLRKRENDRNEPATHIISERLTLGMVKGLTIEEDTVLEVHKTVESALSVAISGDTILLFPGHYKVGPMPWLEQNLTIRGLGKEGEVLIEATEESGDLFLSCSGQSLTLENLDLLPFPGMQATVMVHGGKLLVNRCKFHGAKNALVILQPAEVSLNHCQIIDAQGDGVQLRPGCRCSISSSCIENCFENGVKVGYKTETCTRLLLNNCRINNNAQHALSVECPQEILDLKEDVTWEMVKRFTFLELSEESVETLENGEGELGLCSQNISKLKIVSPLSDFSYLHNPTMPKPKFPNLCDSDEY